MGAAHREVPRADQQQAQHRSGERDDRPYQQDLVQRADERDLGDVRDCAPTPALRQSFLARASQSDARRQEAEERVRELAIKDDR